MNDTDILLFGLASLVSLIIIIIWNTPPKASGAVTQNDLDAGFICGVFLSKVSFEWKFLEEIVDEIFLDPDVEIQDVLDRVLSFGLQDKANQIIFVEEMIRRFAIDGFLVAEEILYTQSAHPYAFKSLPLWKREACEVLLKEGKDPVKETGLIITRVKKISQGSSGKSYRHEEKKWLGFALS